MNRHPLVGISVILIPFLIGVGVFWLLNEFKNGSSHLRQFGNSDRTFVMQDGALFARVKEAESDRIGIENSERVFFRTVDRCTLTMHTYLAPNRQVDESQRLHEVIDFEFDPFNCSDRTVEELIREAWDIDADVTRYPITFYHRGIQALREAEGMDRQGDRENALRSFEISEKNLETAKSKYQEDVRFVNSLGEVQFRSKLARLNQVLTSTRLSGNFLSDTPRHELVRIPSGSYNSSRVAGYPQSSFVEEYWIDRYEVSNHQFRATPVPGAKLPATPDAFPVVGVPLEVADDYCKNLGLRLPTRNEFERAGVWSKDFEDNDRLARLYPWGDTPPAKLSGGQGPSVGDIAIEPVRRVQDDPTGGSDFNVFNLATNVPEWVAHDIDGTERYIKGALYDRPDGLDILADHLATAADAKRIGFRCVFRPPQPGASPGNTDKILMNPR
mmetsp:Transcript_23868/g.43219  ORF Transcript_23868/g.43219 Transcript_23868/m.43219 type:complete len:443 (+) Transcript_23868:10530-11858(+)